MAHIMVTNEFRFNTQNKEDSGFTLLELLIVVVVIGVLSSIAVLGFSGMNKTSRVNSCKVDWSTANSALLAYLNDYPTEPNPVLLSDSTYTLYSQGSGTLSSLGYLSPLVPNQKYYKIILSRTIDPVSLVVTFSLSVQNAAGSTLSTGDNTGCSLI